MAKGSNSNWKTMIIEKLEALERLEEQYKEQEKK